MPESLRIAVVEPSTGSLASQFDRLPRSAEVRAYPDLYQDFDGICRFSPKLLVIDASELGREDVGALRLLRHGLPSTRLALAVSPQRQVEVGRLGEDFDAALLPLPATEGDLAALLASIEPGASGAGAAVFLDLARGISDEINNPLLFASGHLQLLEAGLDADRDADALTQIRAAREGLQRITATMTKVRQLAEASAGRDPGRPIILAAELREACNRRGSDGRNCPPLSIEDGATDARIRVEPDLLRAALDEFLAISAELSNLAEDAELFLEGGESGLSLRLELRRTELPEWKLPRSFEPYHLNRTLRGTTHGLGLFLVQTVIHAAGGLATARRRVDGGLDLELLVPTSTPEREFD